MSRFPSRRLHRPGCNSNQRSHRTGRIGLLSILLAAFVVAQENHLARAQPDLGIGGDLGEEQVTVDADSISYDREKARLRAEGDVVISSGGTVLAADRILVEQETGEAEATGQVLLEDPEARIQAEKAWVELDDETGYLVDGEVLLRQSRFLLSGDRIEKGLGQSYRIWDGEFTTCLCDEGDPDWSIHGERLDLPLGGWGEVRGGVFKVKGIPLVYLPYGLFPVGRERQSGLLFPSFGLSNNRGFQYVQPFYWAIDKSSDLTLSFDLETKARMGVLADYRYVLSPTSRGLLTASYFNEKIGGDRESEVVDPGEKLADPTIPENRWSVIGYHQQSGPLDSEIYVRPFYVSDNLFLREMNTLSYVPATNLFLSTIRYTTSEVGMVKVGSWGMFKAEAKYFQDLIQEQSRVPQPLPNVTLRLRERIFDRLSVGLNTQAVYYYREDLASGPRIDIAPEVSLPYRVGPYGFGSVSLILRETLYYLVNNEIPDGFVQSDGTLPTRTVDRFQHREILQLAASFRSEVSRVYELSGGSLRKLKHTIEPFIRYDYIPYVNQEDLPVYDGWVDRINARNLVTYGFLTRFLGKFGAPPELISPLESEDDPVGDAATVSRLPSRGASTVRELGRFQIQQSYELGRPIFYSGEDFKEKEYLSGIDLFGRFTPVGWAGFNSRAVFSVADRKFVFANVGINIFDPRPIEGEGEFFQPQLRPAHSASLFYQFNTNGAVENLNVATTLRLTNHLAVSYLGRFDGESGRFLENWAGVRVISGCDCWVFDAAVVDRINPDELEFRFRFSLVGLGTFGQSPFAEFNNAFPTPATSNEGFGGFD